MSSLTPNSLPGFLRRTIRTVNDDEDDEEEEVDDLTHEIDKVSTLVGSPHRTSLIPPTTTTTSSKKNLVSPRTANNDDDTVNQNNKNDDDSIRNNKNGNKNKDTSTTDPTRQSNQQQEEFPEEKPTNPMTRDLTQFHVHADDVNTKFRVMTTSDKISNRDRGLAAQNLDDVHKHLTKKSVDLQDSSQSSALPFDSKTPPQDTSRVSPTVVSSSSKTPPIRNYKEEKFEKVIGCSVVDIEELRKLAWNGIPPQHRPLTWRILLGYLPANASRRSLTLKRKRSEYRDAIAQHYDIEDHSRTMQEQETLRQVLVDVPRTAPDVPLFRNDLIRQSLARLLYIWAMRHPASSYVQGINDLATPLIAVFLSEYLDGDVLQGESLEDLTLEILNDVEADVYWCLTNLLAGIQDHYTQDQPGVQRMVMKLEELIKRIDSSLTNHLEETGVQFMQFAFRWMNCLLLREFNLRSVIRLWDTYLSEGHGGFETFHVYVCASFLCQFSSELQHMQFDELFAFMQNIPTGNWDDGKIEIVLSQAFVLSTLFQGSDAHLTSSSPKHY